MALNKSTGNMYAFVSHTYNPMKGECEHSCAYCFMRRKLLLPPLRLELKELKVNLGEGNFIFVGSSTDGRLMSRRSGLSRYWTIVTVLITGISSNPRIPPVFWNIWIIRS